MELTKKDWEFILKLYGGDEKCLDSDKSQIAEAVEQAEYYWYKNEDVYGKKIPLTRTGVIRILGRETWLGGLVRAAFHWDAARQDDKGRTIFFDCRKWLKG